MKLLRIDKYFMTNITPLIQIINLFQFIEKILKITYDISSVYKERNIYSSGIVNSIKEI
jgi:hypothetical protein